VTICKEKERTTTVSYRYKQAGFRAGMTAREEGVGRRKKSAAVRGEPPAEVVVARQRLAAILARIGRLRLACASGCGSPR